MELEGSFTVRASKDRVWSFFMDPYALSSCITDPHAFEIVDEDHFKGWVKAGVAFIKGTFTGSASIEERAPPERARIKAHGAGMGSAFDVESIVELAEAGGATTVRWKANVVLSGTIASVGARLLKGTIDKKTNEFFENARKKIETG
jgi:uncharacterized protein